ncbi:MAG TPA: C4-type zinc ribbon domain-containing protein [Pseudonocardia sp.]|nr:C4-type zinc ribbon domain-containing protein [Pseudonocardia sp.]
MIAEPAIQQRLLQLAEVDTELNRIDHRRRTMPELAEITEGERTVQACKDTVATVQSAAGDLDRDIARLERDVDGVRARVDRDQGLLAGGGVGAKQAVDLQHELDTLARRQGNLEDELLEIMEQREATGANLQNAQVELAAAEQSLTEVAARRDATLADLEAAEAGRRRDRESIAADIPAELLGLYDKLREKTGTGAALIRARRCGACRLELDRSEISAIKNAAPNEVLRHEECGVIMVRTSESGL